MTAQKCQIHQQEFEVICFDLHKCQKRLCSQCFKKHKDQYQDEHYIKINQFVKQLHKKFQILYSDSFIDTCQKQLELTIQSIKLQYDMLFNNMIQSLSILFDSLKQYNIQANYWLEKLKEINLENFTDEELDILNSIEFCFQLQEINNQKQNFTNEIINKVKSIEGEMKQFHQDIIKKVYQKNVILEQQFELTKKGQKIYSQLEGQMYFGFKHGKYTYKIFKKNEISILKAGYVFFNKRQEFWREMQFSLSQQGVYDQGRKVNDWKYYYDDILIAKQSFDQHGLKQRNWLEFNLNQQNTKWPIIVAQGEYKDDQRIGQWKIFKRSNQESRLQQIGGGSYNELGQKIGFWKDVSENLVLKDNQIIWQGEYENGQRIGEWKIFGSFNSKELINFHLIGGGQYDSQGLKTGFWKDYLEDNQDLSENVFLTDTIWQGEYQGGLKVGEWKIMKKENDINCKFFGEGGKYDGMGQKIGLWREFEKDDKGKFIDFILEGQYKSNIKVGFWRLVAITYNSCIGGGMYDNNGSKYGKWKEIYKHQNQKIWQKCSDRCLLWVGHYSNGVKVGKCKIFDNIWGKQKDCCLQKLMMIGSYTNEGKEIGKWIDILKFSESQIRDKNKTNYFWVGEYKDGLKIGLWKQIESLQYNAFSESNLLIYKKKINIYYDDNGIKNGQWIQFQNGYRNNKDQEQYVQFYSQGQYLNGIKVGIWQSYCRIAYYSKEFEQMCFGNYNSEGKKMGLWKDISKHQVRKYEYLAILWEGEYMENVRIGQWKIYSGQKQGKVGYEQICFKAIGGGQYDMDGQKTGQWTEVEQRYQEYLNICYQGEYKQNLRIGEWRIFTSDKNQQIGGGRFNGKGLKIGWWIDIDENPYNKDGLQIWEGNYADGLRVGEWKYFLKRNINDLFNITLLGGGNYDQQGRKEGQWKEINVQKNAYFIWEGQYNQGVKSCMWKLFYHQKQEVTIENNQQQITFYSQDELLDQFQQKNKLILEGEYNNEGKKVGEWKELSEDFYNEKQQFMRMGQYELGIKIGVWKMIYQDEESQITKELGYYNEHGQKIGFWKDINEISFQKKTKIIYYGKYDTGVRQGKWDILYKEQRQSNFESIGGGSYNEEGQKIGVWKDIEENCYNKNLKIVWEGSYNADHRVGEWKILQSEMIPGEFQQIGGGEYDMKGIKIGKWIEFDDQYYNSKIKILWEGDYKAGVRIGNWQITHREQNLLKYKTTKIKEFDQEGNKLGKKQL